MISIKPFFSALLFVQLLMLCGGCAASAQEQQLAPSIPLPLGDNSASLGQRTLSLTLNEAIYLGLRRNLDIRSAYLGRVAEKFELQVANEQFSPQLVMRGRFNNAQSQDDSSQEISILPETVWQTEYGTSFSLSWTSDVTFSNQVGRMGNDGINFRVSQPLLKGAGHDIASSSLFQSRLDEQINILNLQSTVSNVITGIITSYRELLQASEQLEISRQALERSRQLLEINEELISAGRMAEFDSVQTEANIANQELVVIQADDRLQNAHLDLLRLLDLNLESNIQLATLLEPQKIDISLARALSIARTHQPAYLSEEIAMQKAEINLRTSENQTLPDVSLVGGYSQVHDRYANDGSRRWESYIGVQVDIPIGNLSQRQSAVNAHVAKEQQELRIAAVNQALERDVTEAVQSLDTRWQQFQIAKRALTLSRRTLEIEREKLQVGRSSNFQVLSFEADLRNAESARLDALIAYLNAQTAMDQILGTTLERWGIKLDG